MPEYLQSELLICSPCSIVTLVTPAIDSNSKAMNVVGHYLFSRVRVPLSRSALLRAWLKVTLTLFNSSAAVIKSSFNFARSTELMHYFASKNNQVSTKPIIFFIFHNTRLAHEEVKGNAKEVMSKGYLAVDTIVLANEMTLVTNM